MLASAPARVGAFDPREYWMPKPHKKRMRRCHEGKRAFPTLHAAQSAAAAMAQRKDRQGNTIVTFLRAYGCPCGSFHFGKTRQIDWSRVR